MRDRQRGQVLPLFAIMLVALFAIAALAIDISSAYSARQGYRTASDAAALAGAQNLQTVGARTVGPADQTNARRDALQSLMNAYGATGTGAGSCDPTAQINDCQLVGTPIRVNIKTPLAAGSCVSCDPNRSVQVTVDNAQFSLSFARVLGVDHWNVGVSSVAGLFFSPQYGLITLRPPNGTDTGSALGDVDVNGNPTILKITGGDIGTNRSLTSSGTVTLDPTYAVYHFDAPTPWGASPPEHRITSLIQDPKYPYPSSTGAPGTYSTLLSAADTAANCQTIVTTWLTPDPGYKAFVPGFPPAPDMSKINCYRPGIYNVQLKDSNNGDLTVLEPGLYFFKQGITLKSNLVGGYQPNSKGVALVFPQDQLFKNNNTGLVALNAGTRVGSSSGVEATAAIGYDGVTPIVTNTNPAVLMTLMVEWDSGCTVTQPYPGGCDDNHNKTIKLNGGSSLYLAGVQYAPSDNAAIAGNNTGVGYVGQIVAWTVTYSGGSTLNQEFHGSAANGLIRLDGACTAPGTPCSP